MKYYLLLILAILVISCKNNDRESAWLKENALLHFSFLGCSNIYFDKENKDSIWCTLHAGSYIQFKCKDNGFYYTYTAKPDTVFIHDTVSLMPNRVDSILLSLENKYNIKPTILDDQR